MHQNASIFILACALAVQACARDREDPFRAAATPSGPVPPVAIDNGAPLNNAAGYAEQARNTAPEHATSAPAGSEYTAGAMLSPLHGRKIQGEARLEEVAESVRVHIEIEGAAPGTSRVMLRPHAECGALRKAPWESPRQFAPEIGALSVGRGGAGDATLLVEHANLRPDSAHSLLGAALLVYPRREPSATRPTLPIACGKITPS